MKLFFSTEEVASHLNIPVSRLDFYVREFRMNISKVKRVRKYKHADIEKLKNIINLVDNEGFTLDGAKEKLKAKVEKKEGDEILIQKLKEIKKVLLILNNSFA
jgi:DNA-binding transcriptional MerR regulator